MDRFLSNRKDEVNSVYQVINQSNVIENDYICATGFLLSQCKLNDLSKRQIMYNFVEKIGGKHNEGL